MVVVTKAAVTTTDATTATNYGLSNGPTRGTMDKQQLALRALAANGWEWIPGMYTVDGYRIVSGWAGEVFSDGKLYIGLPGIEDIAIDNPIPNFDDPGCLGCLEHLVWRAWVAVGAAYIKVSPPLVKQEPWDVVICNQHGDYPHVFSAASRVEALVLALEAAQVEKL